MSNLGHHYIAELWDCPYDLLDDPTRLQDLAFAAAESAQVSVLSGQFHHFKPQGVTGILLLSESHISLHTWPEHGYCALDFFTCGDADPARDSLLELAGRMGAGRVELKIVERGDLRPPSRMKTNRQVLYPPFQWSQAPMPPSFVPTNISTK